MPTKPKLAKDTIVESLELTGPGNDTDYVFDSSAGQIVIGSLANGAVPKPYALARARANKDIMTMTVLMVRAKAGERAAQIEDILEQLDTEEFEKFFQGWNDHSGVEAGE